MSILSCKRRARGVSLLGYAVQLGLVAAVAIVSIQLLGGRIQTLFGAVGNRLATTANGAAPAASGTGGGTVAADPPGAPSAPDLDAASDTGSSSSDNVTRLNELSFSGTAPAGATIRLYSSLSGLIGSGTATGGGAWTVSTAGTPGSLAEGLHQITATASDANGESAASPALAVTVDQTAPQAQAVSGSPAGPIPYGGTLTVRLTASEPLIAAGTPVMSLQVGSTIRSPAFARIAGGGAEFDYVIQNGEIDGDGMTVTAIGTPGGLTDAAGNAIFLGSLSLPSNLGINVRVPSYGWVETGTATRTMRVSSCTNTNTVTRTCTSVSQGLTYNASGNAGPGDQIPVYGGTVSGRTVSFHGGVAAPAAPTIYEARGISGYSEGTATITLTRGVNCGSDSTAAVSATIYECRMIP